MDGANASADEYWSEDDEDDWNTMFPDMTRSESQDIRDTWRKIQDANPDVLRPRVLPAGVWSYGGNAAKASGSGEGCVSGTTDPAILKYIFMFVVLLLYLAWKEDFQRTGVHVPFKFSITDLGSTFPHTHTHTHTPTYTRYRCPVRLQAD
jgi:hypothetical protein